MPIFRCGAAPLIFIFVVYSSSGCAIGLVSGTVTKAVVPFPKSSNTESAIRSVCLSVCLSVFLCVCVSVLTPLKNCYRCKHQTWHD